MGENSINKDDNTVKWADTRNKKGDQRVTMSVDRRILRYKKISPKTGLEHVVNSQ